ncbi:MAG: hydroxymethylbilane synthase [Candidatus Dormibacteraeota bacterium]|nr:hydroxymethylbilane synthase [Candidatus Dormibacteraeota bacterium]
MTAIGTRGSPLAVAQANLVLQALRSVAPALELTLELIQSEGDLNPELPVPDLAGQGWFSSRLERALAEGIVDVLVHSAKDLPSTQPPELTVAAYLPREDPRDCLVTLDGSHWRGLKPGTAVGTSSPRRAAQLLALRPDLVPTPIRGNVDTRLGRMGQLGLGAIMVAGAGLNRLGRGGDGFPLDPVQECTPAPAQGAIAVQVRRNDPIAEMVAAIDDHPTRSCVEAERVVLAAMGGGCRLPLGALAQPLPDSSFRLTVAWSPTGSGADLERKSVILPSADLVPGAEAIARHLSRGR